MNKLVKKLIVVCFVTIAVSLYLSLQVNAGTKEVQPVLKATIVEANENTTTKRAMNSAIIELKHNKLLLVYDDFTAVEDTDPGAIMGKISEDGGRTWGEKYLIQENIGQKNVMNQGIVRLKSGALALFFVKHDNNAQLSMHMKRSLDEGLTWDQPRNITPYSGAHATANDRAVILSSGRIIIPLAGETESVPGKYGAFSIYSDDSGETWTIGQFINMTTGSPAEPVVVELSDKRVMMLIRTTLGYIYKAYSEDGGTTWGDPIQTELTSPYAPAMIKQLSKKGQLLLVWNNNGVNQNRRPLTMAISKDDGETWTNFINLEPADKGVNAYPSFTTHHGEVLITYYTYNPKPDNTYTLSTTLQIWKIADILKK
jgi:sialidase-1